MIQSQDDLINEGAGLYHMNPNPNYNMVHHQTSVITGQLSIRVEELVSYLLEKLETLKDFFGWYKIKSSLAIAPKITIFLFLNIFYRSIRVGNTLRVRE